MGTAHGDKPPLRRLHNDATLTQRRYKIILDFRRTRTTEQILASLLPRRNDPGYQEFLKHGMMV